MKSVFVMGRSIAFASVLCTLARPALLKAQAADQPPEPARAIVFDAAPAPVPALRYQLLPPAMLRRAGNAVPIYLRLPHEQNSDWRSKLSEGSAALLKAPLEQMSLEDAKAHLETFSAELVQLTAAASRTQAEWEYTLEDHDPATFSFEDAQFMRNYARLLGVKARYEMRTGDLGAAITTIQDILAMGRHTATGPSLVNQLIGIAICNLGLERVTELVGQPGAPNLYWGLSALPRPLIPLTGGFETENRMLEIKFPQLRDLTQSRTPEQWKDLAAAMRAWAGELIESERKDLLESLRAKLNAPPTAAQLQMARSYLGEKLQLSIDPRGMSDAEVEVRYTLALYHELVQVWQKWTLLPYWQSLPRLRTLHGTLRADGESRELYPFPSIINVADAVIEAQARTQRMIAILQTCEALRMYVDFTGRLPQALDDVTLVPVPVDPATNRLYRFWNVDGRAILDLADPADDERRQGLPVPLELSIRGR